MIKRLKYFHGTGHRPESKYPEHVFIGISVGSSLITRRILQSFKAEQIDKLSGVYGDQTAGDPVEVDRLEIETGDKDISTIVFNRGISLLSTDNEEIRRLHRFFGVLQSELADLP